MRTLAISPIEIESLAATYENASPQEILREALHRVENITLACSFGIEDMVLLDMLSQLSPNPDVFYLDTDVLFPETYALCNEAIERYGLTRLRQVRPALTLEEQAEQYGESLWQSNPNQCCDLRKVQPLTRVLQEYDGWVTGIRRQQSPTRANAQVFEVDHKFGLVKVNPLATWSEKDVWRYVHEHQVPYNPLHDRGYPSIGCLHCTRPVKPGEDSRAGRWSGFDKTECGLHQ
ncbi:phosphoadenosine phosphosulfate reductase [Alicyclobacillus tengchongensis]|uniref:Adenosine 5'-phosphosulfate reductase n=1 Tax=Alicyclobacillus tolerans TaxID=90970 RepID=A0ABT9LWE8_9BACL|nr:phosphoadenylyl-sulfate reductase [Alicyclobacillus tengchongensis]MDP9728597.1 phosphoadenosine phosphosulfate reductase [Alicyclobacillus tengchongensis]